MPNEFDPRHYGVPPMVCSAHGPPMFFGLEPIYLPGNTPLNTREEVAEALKAVLHIHQRNSMQIDAMYRRYLGDVPIWEKCKLTRPEINHKVVENWLWAVVQFKLGFEAPTGITYTTADEDQATLPIHVLNDCARLDEAEQKNAEAAEWKYVCGTSYKLVRPNADEGPDDAPYYTAALDPRYSGVIYSADPRRVPLIGFSYAESWVGAGGEMRIAVELTAYAAGTEYRWIVGVDNPFAVSYRTAVLFHPQAEWVASGDEVQLYPTYIPIVEEKLNPARMGYVALLSSLADAMNSLQSHRLDNIASFVEALLVFINCRAPRDKKTNKPIDIVSGQSLMVKGTPDMPASVQYLSAQLDQNGAQITKDDLLDAFYEVAGMPSRSARSSGGGDTGNAVLLRDGWGDADTRRNTTVKETRSAETKMLRIKLAILRDSDVEAFRIDGITLADVYIDIPHNRNNNMLVKAQTLQILLGLGIDGEVSFRAVDLFEDANADWEKSRDGVELRLGLGAGATTEPKERDPDSTGGQGAANNAVPNTGE